MRIVIEQSEFRRLSTATKREIIETLAGSGFLTPPATEKKRADLLWKEPFNLTPGLAARLMHGLPEHHRVRLELFAKKGGRVTQKDLLVATRDTDMRVLSHFQAVLSRRLRRLIHDPEKRLHLIGWDFKATKWSKDKTEIEDGIYFVTDATATALRDHFGLKSR